MSVDLGALAGAPVVVLEAPVGFGKTRLAEQLLAARGGRVVRVRVDGPGIADLAAAIVRALRRAALAADLDPSADPSALLDLALGRLAEAGPVQLFVDDVHRLAPPTAAALADLLADRPAGVAVVIAGRAVPRLGLDVQPVGADELRLDATEVAELLGPDAGPATVAEVLAATGGWPAAVVTAVDRLRHDPRWSPTAPGGARALLGRLVDDAVADDPRIPIAARLPLLDDDVLTLLDAGDTRPLDLATPVTGRWRRVPEPVRGWAATAAALDGDLVRAVAAHYARAGELAAALELLTREQPGELADLLLAAGWQSLAELPVDVLHAAVEAVRSAGPPARLAPALLAAAKATESSARELRAGWLDEAGGLDADPATRRAVDAERARDRLRSADVDGGAEWAAAVLAETPASEPATRARALVTIGMRDAFHCRAETLAAAAERFATAAELYREADETQLRAETLARLGYTALHLAGRPAEGVRAIAAALSLLPVGDRNRAMRLTEYADVADVLGDDDAAGAALAEALEIGTRRDDAAVIGLAWWTESWRAARRGDRDRFRVAAAAVEQHGAGWLTGGQAAEFFGSCAEFLSLLGDLAGYQEYLARAQAIADEIGYPEVVAIPRAIYEAEHGDPHDGLRRLAELDGTAAVTPASAAQRALLSAIAHHRLGNAEAAAAQRARADDLARAMGVPDLHQRIHRPQLAALGVLDEPATAPHLQLLGGFRLDAGATDRTPPEGYPAAVVKLLALRGGLTTEAVIELLWPGADPSTARARLRNTLNRLKERSGAVVTRTGDLLRLADGVRVDLAAFEQAAAAALAAPPVERVGRARHALALYAGDLLPADLYQDWLGADRDRLRRQRLALADLVIADCVARGDRDEAVSLLEQAVRDEPTDEVRTVLLCRLLVEQGRPSAAAEVARRSAEHADELGLEPDPEVAAFLRPE